MEKYSEYFKSKFENSDPEDKRFQEYCVEVCELISDLNKKIESYKDTVMMRSLNCPETCSYGIGRNKVTNRYGFIKYLVEKSFKDDVNFLIESIKTSKNFLPSFRG